MDDQRRYDVYQLLDPITSERTIRCSVCDREIATARDEHDANVVIGWHAIAHLAWVQRPS
jgi:hypothetical protein